MSKLGVKIFFIMLLVAVSGLLIVGVFLNYNIFRNFEDYLYQERREKVEELVNILESSYLETEGWSRGQAILLEFTRINRLPLRLEEKGGRVIFDYRQLLSSRVIINLPTPKKLPRQNWLERMIKINPGNDYEIFSLKSGEQQIAKLYWYYTGNTVLSENADFFIQRVNQIIIISAVLVVLTTALISLVFSRYLTKPLLKLNYAAAKVAEGDFDQKLAIKGNDELTELTRSFNEMVQKLKYLERIRKESTGDLAHELRTPLANIKGYLEGIKEGVFDLNQEVILEIEEELERLIRLVNRLNDLTAVERKIINQTKQELLLKPILAEVINSYQPQALDKGINLRTEYPEEEIKVEADGDNLKIIFHNLLSNAFKYTPRGGEIFVRLSKIDNQLVIEVRDTGIGINPTDQPFIFERFYRADKSRSSKTGGIGIGLTITRELVYALGGKITVESEGEGKGTTFKVLLPVN